MRDVLQRLTGNRNVSTAGLSAVGVGVMLGYQLDPLVSAAVAIVGLGAVVGKTDQAAQLIKQRPLSFADPRTKFKLLRGSKGKTGGHINEPTGQIQCELCEAMHTNIDEIPHEEDCPQRYVHSGFYVRKTRRGPDVRVDRDDR